MATSTTNLGLTKPAGTDKIRIAQINGNMDILDEKIGAVGNTSLQAQVTSQNQAISTLNSDVNRTTAILTSALAATKTTFFYGAGNSYTGNDLPSRGQFGFGTFIVNVRSQVKTVLAQSMDGLVAINSYNGSAWSGWQELALNSKLTNKTTWSFINEITTTANADFDQIVSVTLPADITEIMFTLQRASNGRTFASSVSPWTQYKGGAIYASGQYQLYSGTYSGAVNAGMRLINAVAIYQSDSTIEIAINANDEAIKARIFAR